ncbi:hypothetical protein B0T26DRAFT_672714 [Lasiosphaeria miniovina]|uniref:MARVEL domain-containing protein n=1 Tax=Lasiosphaeria miniovina TaxID=1954250 RepID=A0AA40B5L1_9PEZI|nr:uncharacterized protein B0T26DRAFT_672714 [Lasiosphaeria miniovina]KAK0728129.1 hypothetical protein B0T26DRAFT_672714 [Lasiosphaeria miniovina]
MSGNGYVNPEKLKNAKRANTCVRVIQVILALFVLVVFGVLLFRAGVLKDTDEAKGVLERNRNLLFPAGAAFFLVFLGLFNVFLIKCISDGGTFRVFLFIPLDIFLGAFFIAGMIVNKSGFTAECGGSAAAAPAGDDLLDRVSGLASLCNATKVALYASGVIILFLLIGTCTGFCVRSLGHQNKQAKRLYGTQGYNSQGPPPQYPPQNPYSQQPQMGQTYGQYPSSQSGYYR